MSISLNKSWMYLVVLVSAFVQRRKGKEREREREETRRDATQRGEQKDEVLSQ